MNTPAFLRHFLRRFRWGAEIPAFQKSSFLLFWTLQWLSLELATTNRTVLIELDCLSVGPNAHTFTLTTPFLYKRHFEMSNLDRLSHRECTFQLFGGNQKRLDTHISRYRYILLRGRDCNKVYAQQKDPYNRINRDIHFDTTVQTFYSSCHILYRTLTIKTMVTTSDRAVLKLTINQPLINLFYLRNQLARDLHPQDSLDLDLLSRIGKYVFECVFHQNTFENMGTIVATTQIIVNMDQF